MTVMTEERATRERLREHSRLGPATRALRGLDDRELLLKGRRSSIAENRHHGECWQVLVEFYRRRLDTEELRRAASPHFALTARQETVVEVGELWGMGVGQVRKHLNRALFCCEHAEEIWQMCLAGELDGYRAGLIIDAARERLSQTEEIAAYVKQMVRFLRKHLVGVDGDPDADPLVLCTVKQLRNAISYLMRKLRPVRTDEDFRRMYDGRRTYVRDEDNGIGSLVLENRIDKVRLAQHRLTLAARREREAGDERTIEQLRADLALDLIIGTAKGMEPPAYARPVVNLTVPIQTVMGLSDDPGVLSGGDVVPASLARMIAAEPGSTWHRMLTDEAGEVVALSTRSYRPTGPIWQRVVAEHTTCFRSGCDAPSTQGDLDHRLAWPIGPTDTENLWPGCRTDHRTKHAPRFGIEQAADGSYVLRTAAGLRHPIRNATMPVSDRFDAPELAPVDGFQFTATEFVQAIDRLRELDADAHPIPPEQLWEIEFDEGLTEEQCKAAYGAA